jgi:hypothetical protein
MLTVLPKGVKKIFITFLIKDFFHLPLVTTKPLVHLVLRIRNSSNGIIRGLKGNWFLKKPEVEILWHCPFKGTQD